MIPVDPLTMLAVADGLVGLLEKTMPTIAALVSTGEISVERQSNLIGRIDAIRSGVAFKGPEWEQSTGSAPAGTVPGTPAVAGDSATAGGS